MSDKNYARDLRRSRENVKRDAEICMLFLMFEENKTKVAQELGIDRETVARVVKKRLKKDEKTGAWNFKLQI